MLFNNSFQPSNSGQSMHHYDTDGRYIHLSELQNSYINSIEKQIPCLVEKFPHNFLCNFRNVKFIVINDYVLINVDHSKKNFNLKYDSNKNSKKIRISAVYDSEGYKVIFKLFGGNAENNNDVLELEKFKNTFKNIFDTSINEDSLCEKCVFGPGFFMNNECEKTFETSKID